MKNYIRSTIDRIMSHDGGGIRFEVETDEGSSVCRVQKRVFSLTCPPIIDQLHAGIFDC
jgi:hypothetical protein